MVHEDSETKVNLSDHWLVKLNPGQNTVDNENYYQL